MNSMKLSFDTRDFADNVKAAQQKMIAAAHEAARDIGREWEGEAKDLAPIDEGNLTADIQSTVVDVPHGVAAVISVAANAPSASYAIKMHEGIYNLGPKSQKKMDRIGKQVGRRFITRAADAKIARFKQIIKRKMGL